MVVVDAPVDHEKDYTSANNFGGATAGLTFRETYVGGADSGTLHWYDAVPDFLIGSALQSVRNPLDTAGTYPGHAEGKDITGDLGLEQGLRIIDSAASIIRYLVYKHGLPAVQHMLHHRSHLERAAACRFARAKRSITLMMA